MTGRQERKIGQAEITGRYTCLTIFPGTKDRTGRQEWKIEQAGMTGRYTCLTIFRSYRNGR
jgi:hypothetical protein